MAVASGSAANGALITSVPRTSGLQAPVMELTGHSGEVFVARFNPEGNYIASGSMDRSISKYLAPADGPDFLTDCHSAVEDLWQMRELWNAQWTQRRYS